MSDNEIYLLIRYIKSVLWRVAKRLSYAEDAWCLKVNDSTFSGLLQMKSSNNAPVVYIIQPEGLR